MINAISKEIYDPMVSKGKVGLNIVVWKNKFKLNLNSIIFFILRTKTFSSLLKSLKPYLK